MHKLSSRNILVLSPNLRSLGSHHYQSDASLYRAAQALGLDLRFLCHRQARPEVLDALPAIPTFADPPRWPSQLLSAPLLRRLPPQLSGLTQHLLESRRKRVEIERCLASLSGSNPLLLATESTAALNAALCRTMQSNGELDAVLVFHYPASRYLMGHSFRALTPLVEAGRVRLATTNEPLAENYRAAFGLPFEVAPWPLDFPPQSTRPSTHDCRPVSFLAIGGFRLEKGIDLLAAALPKLAPEIDAGRLRFVIQGFPNPQVPEPEADHCFKLLQSFSAAHPGLQIIDRILDPQGAEYQQMYADADAVLLPYRADLYAKRLSAVLFDSLALGKPVVTTEGSCMARQMPAGTGVTFADGDEAALLTAIRQIATELPRFAAAARGAQQSWVAFHNPQNYLRMVARLPQFDPGK